MIERISNLSSGLAAFAWDRYARLYDVAQPLFIRLVGAFGELSYEEFEEDFVTRACLKPGQTVLDVACGTGAGHAALSHAVGPKGKIVAVDISSEMLRRAKTRGEQLGVRNLSYRKADAQRLSRDFDEESFDAVMSCNGLPNFLDPRRALAEMTRVLRPGGTLAVSAINRDACEDILLWRLSARFTRGRFLYMEEYREMLRDLGLVRIKLHEQGLMLIMTARKRMSKKSEPTQPAPGREPAKRRAASRRKRA